MADFTQLDLEVYRAWLDSTLVEPTYGQNNPTVFGSSTFNGSKLFTLSSDNQFSVVSCDSEDSVTESSPDTSDMSESGENWNSSPDCLLFPEIATLYPELEPVELVEDAGTVESAESPVESIFSSETIESRRWPELEEGSVRGQRHKYKPREASLIPPSELRCRNIRGAFYLHNRRIHITYNELLSNEEVLGLLRRLGEVKTCHRFDANNQTVLLLNFHKSFYAYSARRFAAGNDKNPTVRTFSNFCQWYGNLVYHCLEENSTNEIKRIQQRYRRRCLAAGYIIY